MSSPQHPEWQAGYAAAKAGAPSPLGDADPHYTPQFKAGFAQYCRDAGLLESPVRPFGPEELRLRSRAEFVGNECDTDQYRETQPISGLTRAADLLEFLYGASDSRYQQAWHLIQTWVAAAGHSYEGCDEAVPLYELIHDVLWEQGKHPYYGDLQELTEWFAEMDEGLEDLPPAPATAP